MTISVRTINKISEVVEAGFTTERLGLFLRSCGIPKNVLERHQGGKQVYSSKVLYDLHDSKAPSTRGLLTKVVQGLLEGRYLNKDCFLNQSGFHDRMRELEGLLHADGYEIAESRLISSAGEDIEHEETVLANLLRTEGLNEAIEYMDQSADNIAAGNYESANAMTRDLLESVTAGVATLITTKLAESPNLKGHANVRKYLRAKLLDDTEFQILTLFMSWCSSNGSHPGLSDESEARHRRIMTLSLSQYYLEKFRSRYY